MKRKILIIDDEIDLCMMVEKFLLRKNYDVVCAYSLLDGLKKLQEIVPDALLLDNNLPDGLGWMQADAFHIAYPEMRITLISANTMIPYAGPGKAFDRIEKPISLHTLEQYL